MKPFTTTFQAALGATALVALGSVAQADIVHLDDVIIDGSLCVGVDCVNGESFGFDTIRLKENNLRIRAFDTSASASFPSNDWQITFNDSTNGGANKFSIDDIDGGRTPFTIEASAPSHSLYVDDGGRLGFGTATPVVELHVVNGDSPTLRLEQNGSSGFTPQTFDIAANETNFFVRDVTNGSQLPFRIQPGADTNALYIENTNDVGMGTNAPEAELHVTRSDASSTRLFVANTNAVDQAVQIRMISNSDDNRRIIGQNGSGGQESQISLNSNSIVLAGASVGANLWATVSAAGIVTNIGSCTNAAPCDAVFDADVYEVPSIETHAALMWENGYLPAVGPTVNGDPVNVVAKMTTILNELEHAHIYIEQLHGRLAELEAKVAQ